MGPVQLVPSDLTPFADVSFDKAAAMIEDALALAERVAPCITAVDFAYPEAARAILRGAILRWNESGTGATVTQAAGPFSQTVAAPGRRSLFWPSEIADLQGLCDKSSSSIFVMDTAPCGGAGAHSDICALNFGGAYCSCGAVLTNLLYPLYEV